ncbi:extensin-like domain-containing protein [Methylobacterium organophilum]|uniref:Extensin-like C-terminal domain-containing protein n=1 Tax=Methylobacterium organophilum TaxID=410 RepID=A0ABQ4T2X5_METOR|nr:extensin family protein [Methylobacterium organophilum]GJE25583.1 hypothetical protein LKMONMHP_0421 [Methylobacterium organophilum]
MLRRVLVFLGLALFGAGLTGCAINRFEQREPWRDQAEQMCLSRKLVQPTAYVAPGKEIDGPGPCGMLQPFRITRLGDGTVALKQRMTLGCPAVAETEAWLADTIQPAANLYFGQPVVEMNAGTYACRGRNNQVGAKLSEHSFGNAVDVMSFTLADGHVITVKGGWRGTEAEQAFLREVFVGACARFSTVLGPGSNVFHYDHIHVDLARHDPRGTRRICKPLLKFEPQVGPDAVARMPATPRPMPREAAPPQAPVDVEEDDPYGLHPTSARESGTRTARAPAAPSAYTAAPAMRPARPPAPRMAAAPYDAAPGYAEPLPLSAPLPATDPIY